MDGPRGVTLSEIRGGQILNHFTYVWDLKNETNQTDSQIEYKLAAAEGWGVGDGQKVRRIRRHKLTT